jgi:hypothetical protein
MAGVGMTTEVKIGPDSVSFGAAEWLEDPGPAEGVSGYFAAYVAAGNSLAHKPNPNWLPMGDSNNDIRDNAWTKDKPKLKHPTDGTERWWAGSFSWTIPNKYRVGGGGGSNLIGYVTQSFVMDDSGAITVTKGAASATAKPDNQLEGDIQKFKTVQEAKTFLSLYGRGGCIQAYFNYKRNAKADPESVRNLAAALKTFNHEIYTYVTCKNTFSYVGPDDVTLTANGKQARERPKKKLNNEKGDEWLFDVNDVLDFSQLTEASAINLSANIEDVTSSHPHSATLPYPFSLKNQQMAGSDKYTISAFFK